MADKLPRILVGDDQIGVAGSLQQLAFLRNYIGVAEFDFEKDPDMFVERTKIGKYDALLIDLCWEDADREREDKTGYRVLKEVVPYAPVRLLHTSEDVELRRKGMKYGATTCIEKSRSPDYLRTALNISGRLNFVTELDPKNSSRDLERIANFFESLRQVPVGKPVRKKSEMDDWYTQSHKIFELEDKMGIPLPLVNGDSTYLYDKQEWCQGCSCGNLFNTLELRLLPDTTVEEFFDKSVAYDHIIARNLSLMRMSSPLLEIKSQAYPRDKKYSAQIEWQNKRGTHESTSMDYKSVQQLIEKIRNARGAQ